MCALTICFLYTFVNDRTLNQIIKGYKYVLLMSHYLAKQILTCICVMYKEGEVIKHSRETSLINVGSDFKQN